VRTQRGRGNSDFQALNEDGEATILSRLRDYRYDSWRLLAKIGLGWERDRWGLGLTVTTPGLTLWGSGEETISRTLVGQAELPDGSLPTEIAVDFQDDLPSMYNSPWSIAAGAAYSVSEATRAHFSVEWFDSNRRTILDADPFVPQTGGAPIDPSVNLAMNGLVNAGVGVEHVVNDKLTTYGSFRTDFSGAESPFPTETTFAIWDLYHIGGGVQATVSRSDFTIGLVFSRGSRTRPNALLDEDLGGGGELLAGETKFTFTRLTLLLGFQLAFAPDIG
jgi:hypothetical protein